MSNRQPQNLQQRVELAAATLLKRAGVVGPLELLQQMALLSPSHVESWRKGLIPCLELGIQGSPEKLEKTFAFFGDWIEAQGLQPVEAAYQRAGARGNEPLRVTTSGDPAREAFFRKHYVPGGQSQTKTDRIARKLQKAPDLVVFETVSESVICTECKTELLQGQRLCMEKGQPLCLACADLDRLDFLPSGDAAMSRRARKYSTLSAVVVRFRRRRGRYERQGILVSLEAIAKAEAECCADAPERAARRERDAARRALEDQELVAAMTQSIRGAYPGCPEEEARRIALHTAQRGSGRVGRSAAGRELADPAIELAVIAHIRHEHTRYDELLMQGVERQEARAAVRERIQDVLRTWSLP